MGHSNFKHCPRGKKPKADSRINRRHIKDDASASDCEHWWNRCASYSHQLVVIIVLQRTAVFRQPRDDCICARSTLHAPQSLANAPQPGGSKPLRLRAHAHRKHTTMTESEGPSEAATVDALKGRSRCWIIARTDDVVLALCWRQSWQNNQRLKYWNF